MFVLLHIRLIQLRRMLAGLGLFYGLLVLSAALLLMIFCYLAYRNAPECYYLSGGIILLLLHIHLNRKDKVFISRHLSPAWPLMSVEYLAFSLPFTLGMLASEQWYLYPLFIVTVMLLPMLNLSYRSKTRYVFLGRIIPASLFEAIASGRKIFPLFVLLYLASLALCGVKAAPLICLWFINGILCSSFQENESLGLLYSRHQHAKAFLQDKIWSYLKIQAMLFLPPLLLASFFMPGWIGIHVFFWFLQMLLLASTITLKYKSYEPLAPSGSNVLISIVLLSGIIPFLLPLPALLLAWSYPKALHQLDQYFYDYD